jgi:hypothetical protein
MLIGFVKSCVNHTDRFSMRFGHTEPMKISGQEISRGRKGKNRQHVTIKHISVTRILKIFSQNLFTEPGEGTCIDGQNLYIHPGVSRSLFVRIIVVSSGPFFSSKVPSSPFFFKFSRTSETSFPSGLALYLPKMVPSFSRLISKVSIIIDRRNIL